MPMQKAFRAISSRGAIFFLPVKGPEEAHLTPEPCDAQNVSLEKGVVKRFLQVELHEGYYVPLQFGGAGEVRYNTSILDREDHHGNP
jgi:hypothetical protein